MGEGRRYTAGNGCVHPVQPTGRPADLTPLLPYICDLPKQGLLHEQIKTLLWPEASPYCVARLPNSGEIWPESVDGCYTTAGSAAAHTATHS